MKKKKGIKIFEFPSYYSVVINTTVQIHLLQLFFIP